jgi:hypothetical protein
LHPNPRIESRAFGFLFISIAIAVLTGTIINEFLLKYHIPIYYQLLSWAMIFTLILGITFTKMKNLFHSIRNRMKNSIKWPLHAKIINGLSWAGPFVAIPVFHSFSQYLILLGIGTGNISTYLLIKSYSNYDNKEQFVVGIIALFMIPVLFLFDVSLNSILVHQHVLVISRLFVAISYGVGGIYALIER